MPDRDNWTITIEGLGPTHRRDSADANHHMIGVLKLLETSGHTILQARYTTGRGEENWRDFSTRQMHEGFAKAASEKDLHEELVDLGVKADATQKQSSAEVGLREPEQEDKRGGSSKGLYIGNSKGSLQNAAGSRRWREEEVPEATYE